MFVLSFLQPENYIFTLKCTKNLPSKIYLIFGIPSLDDSNSNKNLDPVD